TWGETVERGVERRKRERKGGRGLWRWEGEGGWMVGRVRGSWGMEGRVGRGRKGGRGGGIWVMG
ncbi:hypothetical protein, partial [Corynebacterium glyciniphilum]|uniref:hypothetical protein n=1 Tax=Corynebacterium glyciniphilum TaxID=1404244 RepID=UPI003F797F01